jgi:heat shock protein HslJ
MDQPRWAGSMAWLLLLSTLGFCVSLGTAGGLHGDHAELRLDGTWWLVSSGSRSLVHLPPNEVPFFAVTDMTVQGFDGCNSFSGRLDQPGEINSNRVGCSDSAVRLPLDLNDLLTHLKTGRIENNVLRVPARGSFPEATFVRSEGAPKSPDPRLEEDMAVPAR